jgi:hypothetical protein
MQHVTPSPSPTHDGVGDTLDALLSVVQSAATRSPSGWADASSVSVQFQKKSMLQTKSQKSNEWKEQVKLATDAGLLLEGRRNARTMVVVPLGDIPVGDLGCNTKYQPQKYLMAARGV